MQLSLKIISYHRLTPGQQGIFQPQSESFTIGRSDENDWVIPDPQRFLSGVHCRIHCKNDHYHITDTSTNGVFLNGSDKRLERNETVELNHGDKIRIGDYEFEAQIEDSFFSAAPQASSADTAPEADATEDPFVDSFDDPFEDAEPPPAAQALEKDSLKDINTPLAHIDDSPIGNAISIESLMDLDDLDEEQDDLSSVDSLREQHTPLNEAFTPSSHATQDAGASTPADFQSEAGRKIPDNWDEATGMLKVPAQESEPASSDPAGLLDDWPDDWDESTSIASAEPAPQTKPKQLSQESEPEPELETKPARQTQPDPVPAVKPVTPKTARQGGDTLAAFATGAGLEPAELAGMDEAVFFEQIGKMMLEFTEGLVQTLSGRTHIKSEFRLDQTMIRPVENNPFKFSTSTAGTLQQLLSKSNPAYMSGVDAIKEGFDDVNAHQMAVVAGMEAALQDILKRFSPKMLESKMESDSILDNILPGGKKAKYWDMFKLLFDQIAGEAEDDFQQLFGRKFSRAYEEQLSRLKNSHKD
jgi:type VI secretion system protein